MKLSSQDMVLPLKQYKKEIWIKNFVRLRKVEKNKIRNAKYNQKINQSKRTLRSSLNLSGKVFVLAGRLKKKDAPNELFKVSIENMPFFNRNQIFAIYKRAKLNNGSYLYWVEKDGKRINGRFLRQELFAINNQFEK